MTATPPALLDVLGTPVDDGDLVACDMGYNGIYRPAHCHYVYTTGGNLNYIMVPDVATGNTTSVAPTPGTPKPRNRILVCRTALIGEPQAGDTVITGHQTVVAGKWHRHTILGIHNGTVTGDEPYHTRHLITPVYRLNDDGTGRNTLDDIMVPVSYRNTPVTVTLP